MYAPVVIHTLCLAANTSAPTIVFAKLTIVDDCLASDTPYREIMVSPVSFSDKRPVLSNSCLISSIQICKHESKRVVRRRFKVSLFCSTFRSLEGGGLHFCKSSSISMNTSKNCIDLLYRVLLLGRHKPQRVYRLDLMLC